MLTSSEQKGQINWHTIIKGFSPTKIIISKTEEDYSGKRPSVRALIINVEKATHHSQEYGEDWREAFHEVMVDTNLLLPFGCITIDRPNITDLNYYLESYKEQPFFNFDFTLLFITPDGQIWGSWDDGVYLMSHSLQDLIYRLSFGEADKDWYLKSYWAP